MGWVTLTLRKTELKRSHSDYQMKLLQISREKRQMARQKHYEQTVIRNDQSSDLRAARDYYNSQRDALNAHLDNAAANNGVTGWDENGDGAADGNKSASQIQDMLDDERLLYQEQVNEIKAEAEAQLEMLEVEANDAETALDQEQVEVEAQLEAISAEIEAVGEAISSQIQSSTIKLS